MSKKSTNLNFDVKFYQKTLLTATSSECQKFQCLVVGNSHDKTSDAGCLFMWDSNITWLCQNGSKWPHLRFNLVTGSIARSARRQYLIYSEADFEVFRPALVTCCTDWGEIWRGGGDRRLGYRSPKTEILLRSDQNVEYKCPTGAYPLRDFHIICRVCTPFQDALAVKLSLDLLKGLRSYEGFKLMVSGFCQMFSGP